MQANSKTPIDKTSSKSGRDYLGPSISLTGVNLTLGNTQILENISFNVEPGTIHCIIGANGGGKTSLVRSILGQMPHTGQIEINWGERSADRPIGYVPQRLNFDTTLPVTVNDFLTITTQNRPVFLGPSKSRRRHVEEVIGKFGLLDKKNSKLGSLSGGERQRAIFAQAFIPAPSLLVLDEPMTGLDVAGGELLLSVVQEFTAGGGTLIWINHDITQVYEVADKLTYIDKTVKLDGDSREVLRSGAAKKLFPTLHFPKGSQVQEGPETKQENVL